MTLIVVTHDLAVARRAQRVLLLEDGRIARRLAPAELAGALAVLGSAP
jgi:ABC-type lipoprotein export system ATPase subunit